MGQKGMDFKHKEVINIKDGKRLGYVQDVCADLESGTINCKILKHFANVGKVLKTKKTNFCKKILEKIVITMIY